MGNNHSAVSLETMRRVSVMNQSINSFFQIKSHRHKHRAIPSEPIEASHLNMRLNDESVIDLAFNLMSSIAMTKVNTFNQSAYYPITHFNPYEKGYSQSDNSTRYAFNADFAENVNRMFEVAKKTSVPFSIDEDLNEDVDNSQADDKRRDEDAKSKSRYDKSYVSSSMKKLLSQKRNDKGGSDHVSKYSEVISSKSSGSQVLDSDKRKNASEMKDNDIQSSVKPVIPSSKPLHGSGSDNNPNALDESQRSTSKQYDPAITDENELKKLEASIEGNPQYDVIARNGQVIFKIDIRKLIKEERAKKLYQLNSKSPSNVKLASVRKNTTFIEQINKYMELDTSYNAKLNQIRSNKKMMVKRSKENINPMKLKRAKAGKKGAKRGSNEVVNIVLPSDHLNDQEDIIKESFNNSVDKDEDNIIKNQQELNQPQVHHESQEEEKDEFFSACSSLYQSFSNHQCDSSKRQDSGGLPKKVIDSSEFIGNSSLNFEAYD